ncbi:putative uncharacterized protein [Prevotella sp. CAG:255]|uniref:hypothetical protein n=1 Tax=Prevotella sp. CAG:255 TaxID=1262923 RepID=UPI00034040FC|nr:hypothetical protein [Prevotella sp. CAG:255]CCX70556.1 putative uncharacterized protein [Prevotella sp. CAG:255]
MKKLTIPIIMLLAHTKANTQQIKGKVVKNLCMPMEYSSMALIKTADSNLITRELTDKEGKFVVNNTKYNDTLTVRTTPLGYETAYADIPLNRKSLYSIPADFLLNSITRTNQTVY